MLVKTKESGEIFKCGNAERFKGENQGAKLVKEAMDVNIKKWQGNSKWGKKRERERGSGEIQCSLLPEYTPVWMCCSRCTERGKEDKRDKEEDRERKSNKV